MARPNHEFEKRQRELAKKKKKEEKRLRKLEKKNAGIEPGTPGAPESTTPEEGNA